jgi:hypothetical protein
MSPRRLVAAAPAPAEAAHGEPGKAAQRVAPQRQAPNGRTGRSQNDRQHKNGNQNHSHIRYARRRERAGRPLCGCAINAVHGRNENHNQNQGPNRGQNDGRNHHVNGRNGRHRAETRATGSPAWLKSGNATKYPLCPRGSRVLRILGLPSCRDDQNTDSADNRRYMVFFNQQGARQQGTRAMPQLRIKLAHSAPSGRPSVAGRVNRGRRC